LLLVFSRRALSALPDFLGIIVPFTTVAVILATRVGTALRPICSTGIAGVDGDLEDAARGTVTEPQRVPIDHDPLASAGAGAS
jgi:hypothetical protein